MTKSSHSSLVLACYDLDEAVVDLAKKGIFARQYGSETCPQFMDIEILWDDSNASVVFQTVAEMWSSVGPENVKQWQDGEDLAFAEVNGWAELHSFVNSK